MSLTTAEEALVRELIAVNPELLTLAGSEATIISKLGATKKNLGQLNPAGTLSDTDLIFTRQGTLDRAATLSVLKSYALSGVPAASETVAGVVELATVAEAVAGTDTSHAVTPAGVAAAAGGAQIQPISASVSGNALTLTLNPTKLDFRSATLTDGTINKRTLSSAISLTISSGSTLGTANGIAARLVLLALDNAGTLELAVSNLVGGVNLDETTLISTTAEGGAGAADSATVVYSATARTNLPFRVVGFVDITEATAGTWATAPAKVQGIGGRAEISHSGMVKVNTANGYGSSNTAIRRFLNVVTNQGSDITYADSATLGATFTVNSPGVYAISYTDNFTVGPTNLGISLNSTQLSTGISSVTQSNVLSMSQNAAANACGFCGWTGYLQAGDVIRAHTNSSTVSTNQVYFTIARVS